MTSARADHRRLTGKTNETGGATTGFFKPKAAQRKPREPGGRTRGESATGKKGTPKKKEEIERRGVQLDPTPGESFLNTHEGPETDEVVSWERGLDAAPSKVPRKNKRKYILSILKCFNYAPELGIRGR